MKLEKTIRAKINNQIVNKLIDELLSGGNSLTIAPGKPPLTNFGHWLLGSTNRQDILRAILLERPEQDAVIIVHYPNEKAMDGLTNMRWIHIDPEDSLLDGELKFDGKELPRRLPVIKDYIITLEDKIKKTIALAASFYLRGFADS